MVVRCTRLGVIALAVAAALASASAGAAELRQVEVEDLGDLTTTGPVFAADAVVSPDGAHVYALGDRVWFGDVIVRVFARQADGSLAPIASEIVTWFGGTRADELALTPDGRYLYAVVASDVIVVFSRDPSSGLLTRIDGVSDVSARMTVAPDGRNVYALSYWLLATYTRDEASAALCARTSRTESSVPRPSTVPPTWWSVPTDATCTSPRRARGTSTASPGRVPR
jgi:hypothetical protein